jgi:hypothetical protein
MLACNNSGIVTTRVVTHIPSAMERMGKHVFAENLRNNRTMFSVRSVPRGYKKYKEDRLGQFYSGVDSCSRELRESLEMARKELGCEKKASYMLQLQ